MPNIKNQIKKDTLQPPQSGGLLDFPKRPSKWRYLGFIIVAIVIVFALWQATKFLISFNHKAPVPETTPQKQEEKPLVESFYYLTNTTGDITKNNQIYEYIPGSNQSDREVAQVPGDAIKILGKYTDKHKLIIDVGSKGKMKIFNAETGGIENFIDVDSPVSLGTTAISSDKQWIAYSENYENPELSGEIRLHNLKTGDDKLLVKRTKLAQFQQLDVIGWRSNDQQIIVSAIGADAATVQGDIYTVNIDSGELVKLTAVDKKDNLGFLLGKLSPDGDKWLYPYCAEAKGTTNIDEFASCNSGKELRSYDFKTKQSMTLYRNEGFEGDANQAALRNIMDFAWQGDANIIAAIPGSILQIPADGGKVSVPVVVYDQGNLGRSSIRIVEADNSKVVYTQNNELNVYDRGTDRITNLNLTARHQTLSAWLE